MKTKRGLILVIGLICLVTVLCGYKLFFVKASEQLPKISVIIPVYNVEKYLDECLDSVENQTLKDIEIICVDDGSTDNSPEILEVHKSKDNRIKVITKQNGGVAEARNTGIDAATGEYIAFLDSDDIILPNAYEVCYKNLKRHCADILEYRSYQFNDGEIFDKNQIPYDSSTIEVHVKREKENANAVLSIHSSVVWDKIWKTSLIKDNNLRFAKGIKVGEDTLFDWLAFPLAKKSVVDKNRLYCYRVRSGSAMNSTKSKNILEGYMIIIDELVKHYPERFNFKHSDKYLLELIFFLTQGKLSTLFSQLETKEDKAYFVNESVKRIESFINEYNIKLDKEYESKLNELKTFTNV